MAEKYAWEKNFLLRLKPGSFTIDQVMEALVPPNILDFNKMLILDNHDIHQSLMLPQLISAYINLSSS